MDKQPETKTSKKKKASKSEKKTKHTEKKRVPVPKLKKVKQKKSQPPDTNDTPEQISTNITNVKEIKKTLNAISLTQEEIKLLDNQIQYQLNKNKLETTKNSHSSLHRNRGLDRSLKTEFEKINKNSAPKPSSRISKLMNLIDQNTVIVVHGEPQCGKTTQIPQIILNEFIRQGNGSVCKIVSTQPTRKFVMTAFDKVSQERRGIFGNGNGINYQIRFDSFESRKAASITYCTTGIFLKRISNSSYLNQITHLIIDEIQERDVVTDFLLALMKEIITKRSDFKLILICTTVYSKKICKYFNNCNKINISPALHPITEYYLEDIILMTDFDFGYKSVKDYKDNNDQKWNKIVDLSKVVQTFEKENRINLKAIMSVIKYISKNFKDGNILIFLPTYSSIINLKALLMDDTTLTSKMQIVTRTHIESESSTEHLKFSSSRIVFLTINEKLVDLNNSKILFVIDSGKIMVKFHDVVSNVEIDQNDWISQKTSKQRRHLAGRNKPGFVFHLFSRDRQKSLDKYPIPKIMSSDFENVILEMKGFGINDTEMFLKSFLTSPDLSCSQKTIDHLKNNNILSNEELLTPLGFHIVKLPLNFTVGKMVIFGALFSCLQPVLTIAAYFSFPSIFVGYYEKIWENKQKICKSSSDILIILDLLKEFEKSNKTENEFFQEYLIRPTTFKEVDKIIQQLADRLFEMKFLSSRNYDSSEFNLNSNNLKLINALLSIALYPNIVKIKNYNSGKLKNITLQTITEKSVYIHCSSINSRKTNLPSPLLMYRSFHRHLKEDFIQDTTFVTPLQVLFFANDVKYSTENQNNIITIAESLKIYCSSSSIIQVVQEDFNFWLDYKLKNPSFVDWKKESWDTCILQAVIKLLDNEETSFI